MKTLTAWSTGVIGPLAITTLRSTLLIQPS